MYQFNSTSTLIEGRGFDGSGGSGDCHIRTATAGGAHAVPAYRHIFKKKFYGTCTYDDNSHPLTRYLLNHTTRWDLRCSVVTNVQNKGVIICTKCKRWYILTCVCREGGWDSGRDRGGDSGMVACIVEDCVRERIRAHVCHRSNSHILWGSYSSYEKPHTILSGKKLTLESPSRR